MFSIAFKPKSCQALRLGAAGRVVVQQHETKTFFEFAQKQRFVTLPTTKTSTTASSQSSSSSSPVLLAQIPKKNPSYMQSKQASLEETLEKLDVRLTEAEVDMLRKRLDRNHNGIVSRAELAYAGHKARDEQSARELCLTVVEKPIGKLDHLGAKAINILDFVGTALFSTVATLVAGDAGMNIIGCCLVGSVGALGGGTLNNLFYNQPVFWTRNFWYVTIAVSSSLVTFFAWPAYVTRNTDRYFTEVFQNLEEDGTCGKEAFVSACHRDKQLANVCRAAMPFARPATPGHYFDLLDKDGSKSLDHQNVKKLVQDSLQNSFESYVLDTAALAAFTVAAVHNAVSVGLHPVVAVTSGITMCFGGIFRDLFCKRDLSIAGQSYAFCTGSGSIVYVALREMALRGYQISLIVRVCMSVGTVASLRGWEYMRGEPLLSPMHGRKEDKKRVKIRRTRTILVTE